MSQFRPSQVTRYQTAVERAAEVPMTLEANPTPDRPMGQFPRGRDSLQEIAKVLTDPTYAAEKRAEAIPKLEPMGDVFDEADVKQKIKTIENLPGYSTDRDLKAQVDKIKNELAIRDAAATGATLTGGRDTGANRAKLAELTTKTPKAIKLEADSDAAAQANKAKVAADQAAQAAAAVQAAADDKAAQDAVDLTNMQVDATDVRFHSYDSTAHDAANGPAVFNDPAISIAAYTPNDIADWLATGTWGKSNDTQAPSGLVAALQAELKKEGDLPSFAAAQPDLVGRLARLASIRLGDTSGFNSKQVGDMFKHFSERIATEVTDPAHLVIAAALFKQAQNKWGKRYRMGQ